MGVEIALNGHRGVSALRIAELCKEVGDGVTHLLEQTARGTDGIDVVDGSDVGNEVGLRLVVGHAKAVAVGADDDEAGAEGGEGAFDQWVTVDGGRLVALGDGEVVVEHESAGVEFLAGDFEQRSALEDALGEEES